jgi:CrcB protein
MQNLLAIAIGGALGALCRYGANVACVRWFAASTVFATFTVNFVGCLLIGLLAASPLGQKALAHAVLGVGFLGALTTFSTFGIETVRLYQLGSPAAAAMNVAANVILGIAATLIGLMVGRALF